MTADAQQLYVSIATKQEAQAEAEWRQEEAINKDDQKMYLRKARQGHIYGRTRHPSLEEKDNGRSPSTSSEWSDASGTRPETEAIRRDDTVAEGVASAADGVAETAVGVATSGAGETTSSAAARGANRRQRK